MYRAVGVEPTNDTPRTSGWVRSASTASLSPWTTLNTPSGSPAACSSSARRTLADGSFSDGFSTNELPQAMAIGNIHSGTMAGKLNGVIPAHTPSAWSSEWQSTPRPILGACSPLSRCGAAVANSTTSAPRCTALAASLIVFPCSSEMMRARFSRSSSRRSRNFARTRARVNGGVALHRGPARCAASIAMATSAPLANGTCRIIRPSAGSNTGPERTPSPLLGCPSIHIGTVAVTASPVDNAVVITPLPSVVMKPTSSLFSNRYGWRFYIKLLAAAGTCSDQRPRLAAIDCHARAAYPACALGRQEGNNRRDFLDRAEPP